MWRTDWGDERTRIAGMAALLPTTTDEALKVTLVLALGKTGDQRALPPLRKVLEQIVLTNNLPKAREAAFVALAAAGDKGAIPRAIQIITTAVVPPAPGGGPTFDDDFVRVAALRYLGAVGDRATGTTLLAAIKHGVTREMRLTVAEALGKLLGHWFCFWHFCDRWSWRWCGGIGNGFW